MNNQEAMMSSEKQTWNTPNDVLSLIRLVAPIYLDPCSNEKSIVQAQIEWRGNGFGDDGLANIWKVPEGVLAFCNPPYDEAQKWMEKCEAEGKAGINIIALLPARTDTLWFHGPVLRSCDQVCFWKGRITFLGGEAGAPFPSALFLWSRDQDIQHRFRKVFSDHGWVVPNDEPF
jgi:site-specific DNA-methyltransferase (adenine-specific)